MRLSGPLCVSGYCLGKCWRLAWLRDAERPRAEGQAAVARGAAARIRVARRELGRQPAFRGEVLDRPVPAVPRATARVAPA